MNVSANRRCLVKKLLIVSLDAVGDAEFDRLAQHEVFSSFIKTANVHRGVSSVFVSNTYPIHASVVTGVPPVAHGLVCNTHPFPSRHAAWRSAAGNIKAKTLWDAAFEKKLQTAAVMWPVTAHSKKIRYNIPEVMAALGKNQVFTSLKAGSKLLQIQMYLRHRHLLRGIAQPWRDEFATACMADILRAKRPALALMHLTAYDTLCHKHGKDYDALQPAFASLAQNLNTLLGAIDGDTAVIVFSDHGQLPVHTSVQPNHLLAQHGWLTATENGYAATAAGCYFECAGGSAFFHPGKLEPQNIQMLQKDVRTLPGFSRFLTPAEMQQSGHGRLPFGFCAQVGYSFDAVHEEEKANHGYPVDYENYKVFYAVRAPGFTPGPQTGGSLLDIAPIAAQILDLDMPLTKNENLC